MGQGNLIHGDGRGWNQAQQCSFEVGQSRAGTEQQILQGDDPWPVDAV